MHYINGNSITATKACVLQAEEINLKRLKNKQSFAQKPETSLDSNNFFLFAYWRIVKVSSQNFGAFFLSTVYFVPCDTFRNFVCLYFPLLGLCAFVSCFLYPSGIPRRFCISRPFPVEPQCFPVMFVVPLQYPSRFFFCLIVS